MSNKALKIDYDKVLEKTDSSNLYCLSDKHIEILLSQTEYIGWSKRYESMGYVDSDVIDNWKSQIERSLISPMNCDSGEVKQTNITINNYIRIQRYDDTNGSIDPNAPSGNFNYDGSSDEDNALCMAVDAIVRGTLLNVHNALAPIAGIVGLSAGILGWVTGGLGAIVGGVVVLGFGVIASAVDSAIKNEVAIQSYVCRMFNQLKGVSATQSLFTSSILSISPSSGDETTIDTIMNLTATRIETYLWFLELLGNAFRLSSSGLDNCGCVTCENRLATFDIGGQAYTIITGSLTVGESGNGVLASYIPGYGGALKGWEARVQFPLESYCAVKTVSIRGRVAYSTGFPSGAFPYIVEVWKDGVLQADEIITPTVLADMWVDVSYTFSSAVIGDMVQIYAFNDTNTPSLEIQVKVDDVRIIFD